MKRKKKLISSLIILAVISLAYLFQSYPTIVSKENINKRVNEVPVINEKNLTVTFIDVGQADSILLESAGEYMLVDAGNNEDGVKLVNYFRQEKISSFKYVVATHPHEDHIGGMDDVINNFPITNFYMPDVITTTKTFEDVISALESKDVGIIIPNKNDTFDLGSAEVKVLYVGTEEEKDLNDTSIILKVTYQNISFLLTGDASTKIEETLDRKDLESTVLKVAHHGSATATDKEFISLVKPTYAVISVGKNNTYHHPTASVLNTLAKNNITTYRTDEDHTIKMITDGTNIEIKTQETNTNG